MIHESAPWKDRLAKDADFIDRWAAKPKITERRSVLIEQKTFVAAYSIRKLLQAGKLSSSFEGRSVPCDAAPLVRGKKIDRYNAHRYVELYDFDKMARQAISAPALLDLLIHSLLFAEPSPKTIGSPGFSSPLIVSAQRYGWSISMRTPSSCAKLLQTTRTRGHWARNLETGEYVEWTGRCEPPAQVRAKMDRVVRSNRSHPPHCRHKLG